MPKYLVRIDAVIEVEAEDETEAEITAAQFVNVTSHTEIDTSLLFGSVRFG